MSRRWQVPFYLALLLSVRTPPLFSLLFCPRLKQRAWRARSAARSMRVGVSCLAQPCCAGAGAGVGGCGRAWGAGRRMRRTTNPLQDATRYSIVRASIALARAVQLSSSSSVRKAPAAFREWLQAAGAIVHICACLHSCLCAFGNASMHSRVQQVTLTLCRTYSGCFSNSSCSSSNERKKSPPSPTVSLPRPRLEPLTPSPSRASHTIP
eukprot:3226687-Pleurochrysis_carterae.AAC.4